MKNKRILKIIIALGFFSLVTANIEADTNFDKCLTNHLKQYKVSKSKLEYLNCRNSNISDIDGIEKLTNLRQLDLGNNNLSDLTKLSKLKKLEDLNVSGNTIYYLPPEINNLTKLIKLDLSNIHLLSLPKIDKLKKLEYLALNNNQLLRLPSLKSNPLTELKIERNYLTSTSVNAKNSSFKITKQRKIVLANSSITLTKEFSLLKPKEKIQRLIVSDDGIPIYGVKDYILYDVVDDKNKAININDYFNLDNGAFYKSVEATGKVSLRLDTFTYKTELKVKIKGEVGSEEGPIVTPVPDPQPTPNPNPDSKDEDKPKEENKDVFNNLDRKDFSEKNTLDFFTSDNLLLLSCFLFVVTFLPLIVIYMIIKRIKDAKEDIEDTYSDN